MFSHINSVVEIPSESGTPSSGSHYSDEKMHDMLKISISKSKKYFQPSDKNPKTITNRTLFSRTKSCDVDSVMQRLRKFDEKYSKKNVDAPKISINPQRNIVSDFEQDSSLLVQKGGNITMNDTDDNLGLNDIKEKSNSQFHKISDSLSQRNVSAMESETPISKVILEISKRNNIGISEETESSFKVQGGQNTKHSNYVPVQKTDYSVIPARGNHSKTDANYYQKSSSNDVSISEEFSFRSTGSENMDNRSMNDDLGSDVCQYLYSETRGANVSKILNEKSESKNYSKNENEQIHTIKTTKSDDPSQQSNLEVEDEFEQPSQRLEVGTKFNNSLSLQGLSNRNSTEGLFNVFTFEDLVAAHEKANIIRGELNSTETSHNKQVPIPILKGLEDSLLKSEDEIHEEIDEVLQSQSNSVLSDDDDDDYDDNASVKTNSSYEEMMNELSSDSKIESGSSTSKEDNGSVYDKSFEDLSKKSVHDSVTDISDIDDQFKTGNKIKNFVSDITEARIENSVSILSIKSENIDKIDSEHYKQKVSPEFYHALSSDLDSINEKQDYPVLNIKLPSSFKSKSKYKIIITKNESDHSALQSNISAASVEVTKTKALQSSEERHSTKSETIKGTDKSNSKDVHRYRESNSSGISKETENDSRHISVQSSLPKDDKSETESNKTLEHSDMLDKPIAEKTNVGTESVLGLNVKSTQFCDTSVQTENMHFITTDFTLNNSSFLQTDMGATYTLHANSLPLYQTMKFEATSVSSELVFNEILRHQIELTKHFINSQQKMYQAYCQSVNSISNGYKAVTLEDTREYIRGHRRASNNGKTEKKTKKK